MRTRPLAAALAAAMLTAAPGSAVAAPEDDYVALMTAVEIDKACQALRYMESSAVRSLAFDYLMATSQWALMSDGRMPQEDYDVWQAELDEKAAGAAAAAGCSDQAVAPILMARAKAAEKLYQGLVLAFFFDSLAEDDIYRRPLDDYEKQAAAGYDALLQQLYGQSFQDFAAYNRQQAQREIPEALLYAAQQSQDPMDDLYNPLGMVILSTEESSQVYNAQSIAIWAMNAVQFEVTAEVNGYQVRPYAVLDDWIIPELRRPQAAEGLPVVHGPYAMLIDTTPEIAEDSQASWADLYWIAALKPDRGLRIMFYGQTAAGLTNPIVRLHARNQPLPEGTRPYEVFDKPDFRGTATVYEPVAVTEGCLGGPCFDFLPEVTDALLAFESDSLAELYVATSPDAPYPFTLRQGRFDVSYLWKIIKGAE